jgi:multiple sugar transport system ATP-binding protein
VVAVSSQGRRWPVAAGTPAAAGQKVHYGIRPGDMTLASQGVPAEVVVVEPTGAETELLLKVSDEPDAEKLVMVMHGRTDAKPGDTVHLAIDVTKSHVFDSHSGQRLAPSAA